MESSESLRHAIIKRYNTDPRSWHVLVGRDVTGYYDTYVIHGEDIWILKEENINPYKRIGLGVKTQLQDISVLKRLPDYTFGFRPVSEKIFLEALTGEPSSFKIENLISTLLKTEPKALQNISSPLALQGPILYSQKSIEMLSPKNKDADSELREALESLLNRKYPHLRSTYR